MVTAAVLLVMAITGSFKTNTNKLDNFVGFSYDELISSNKYDYEFVLEQKKTDEVEPVLLWSNHPKQALKLFQVLRLNLSYLLLWMISMFLISIILMKKRQKSPF